MCEADQVSEVSDAEIDHAISQYMVYHTCDVREVLNNLEVDGVSKDELARAIEKRWQPQLGNKGFAG